MVVGLAGADTPSVSAEKTKPLRLAWAFLCAENLAAPNYSHSNSLLVMFDFENLEVYSKSKIFNQTIFRLI